MKNYYKILEINEEASTEVIKASYKALMKKYHPDNNVTNSNYNEVLEINEAYEILLDKEKRQLYDVEYKKYKEASKQNNFEQRQYSDNSTVNNDSFAYYQKENKENYTTRQDKQQKTTSTEEKSSSCLGSIVKWFFILVIFSYVVKGCTGKESDTGSNLNKTSTQGDNIKSTSEGGKEQVKSNKITKVRDEKNREIYYFPNKEVAKEKLAQLIVEGDEIFSIKASKEWFGSKVTYSLDEDDDREPDFIYQGEMKDGKPHGIGMLGAKVELSDGFDYVGSYVGWFKNGVKTKYGMDLHVPTGEEIFTLERIYSDIVLDEYNEKEEFVPDEIWDEVISSVLEDLNYLVYEGEFDENGLYSGKGNLYIHPYWEYHDVISTDYGNIESIIIQTGQFKDGKMNGNGVFYGINGDILYEGQWKNGDFKNN